MRQQSSSVFGTILHGTSSREGNVQQGCRVKDWDNILKTIGTTVSPRAKHERPSMATHRSQKCLNELLLNESELQRGSG